LGLCPDQSRDPLRQILNKVSLLLLVSQTADVLARLGRIKWLFGIELVVAAAARQNRPSATNVAA